MHKRLHSSYVCLVSLIVAVASHVPQLSSGYLYIQVYVSLMKARPFILTINSVLYIPSQRLQIHVLSGCRSVASTATWADHQASEAFLQKPGFKLLIKVALDSKSTCHLVNLGDRCLSQQWAQKFFHILL